MATESAADIRALLDDLGQRKRQHDADDEELVREMKRIIPEAKRQKIPMNEIADRLGIHRTTLYRVYT